MQALLAALRPGCRLVLVGDPDQLPSVGAGNVFGDLIRSGCRAVSRPDGGVPSGGAVGHHPQRPRRERGAARLTSRATRGTSSSCAAARRTGSCRRWWSCAKRACPRTWASPPTRFRCSRPPGRGADGHRRRQPRAAGGAEPAGARQAAETVGRAPFSARATASCRRRTTTT